MVFGNNLTTQVKSVLSGKNVFTVTDDNVFSLYPELFNPARTFVFAHGEGQKHLGTVSDICAFLFSSGADRHAKIAAVGGGVVGDAAGFAASVYMRGIPWINIPTTLLAQCDSAVGGKTGVDLAAFKNIVGAFHFPEEIYFSAHFLETLPEREVLCGWGEVVKTACLSPEIFEILTKNEKRITKNDEWDLGNDGTNPSETIHYSLFTIHSLSPLVRLCAEFKDSIVRQDPFEKTGLRKILNYGHTVGHALEAADNHRLSHGEYVLHGILIENRMCRDLIDSAFYDEIERLVGEVFSFQFSVFSDLDIDKVVEAAMGDKKNADGKISVIAVIRPGEHREVFFSGEEFERKLKKALP
ncbi:MAG: 3-dehydroquinate synthase [Firmicutes bacterium]|nr:3-dehydroquinate synthase [Bacillota bacterium]